MQRHEHFTGSLRPIQDADCRPATSRAQSSTLPQSAADLSLLDSSSSVVSKVCEGGFLSAQELVGVEDRDFNRPSAVTTELLGLRVTACDPGYVIACVSERPYRVASNSACTADDEDVPLHSVDVS